MAELFAGWPVVLGLGVLILLVGLMARAAKKKAGSALLGLGIFWLAVMGLYVGLLSVGQYYPQGSFPIYSAPYILAVLIFLAGVALALRTARLARRYKPA